jgi:hypothetical protein
VFVFAVSQLSEHLLHDLTWRGAAETLVLLCAEFTVWLLTTFEATHFGSEPVTLTWHPSGSAAGFHKSANVLSALPKSAHPGAKKALAETWGANPTWVNLRHRPASAQGHQGSGLAGGRAGDGVNAHRVGPSPLRAVNAPHLVALVGAGARFIDGRLVERPDESADHAQAA